MEKISAEKVERKVTDLLHNSVGERFARIARCQRCDASVQSPPVVSKFTGQRWILVGQAPGKKEIETGQLFVGPAGRRLFNWLTAAGWQETPFRNHCYLTAVLKCFPGKGARGDLKPTPWQLANCSEWLETELHLVQPEVIIPVGQLAIQRFLGKVKLSEVVGKRFRKQIARREVSLIPLPPHPSGASAWTNRKENKRLILRAINFLTPKGNLRNPR